MMYRSAMQQQPRLQVEFLGLPGSGKSTLSHALADVLRRHGLAVDEPTWIADHRLSDQERRAFKTRRVAVELLRRPGAAARAFGTVVRSRQCRPAETLRATRNWLFISSLVGRPSSSAAVQLLDQGVFQALWTVGFEADADDPAGLLRELVEPTRCPDVVVVLEVGVAEVQRRLAQRTDGMSRMDGSGGRGPERWWRAQRALAEARKVLDAVAAATGRPTVVRIRNEERCDVQAQAEGLAAVLLSAAGHEVRCAPLAAPLTE